MIVNKSTIHRKPNTWYEQIQINRCMFSHIYIYQKLFIIQHLLVQNEENVIIQTNYFGCFIGTSKINSAGISNISGSIPLACRISGKTSNIPNLGFQPIFITTYGKK